MEIRQLTDEVVDKIAAGEVVDRPAHMVKELVENSLDAGADKVEVLIDEGGKSIEIIDNGKGVLQEDLSRVFSRHATSKISDSDDLWKLHTFGFRGEALASISSVARMQFTSRRRGLEGGYRVNCDFGSLSESLPISASEGTRVEVRDLFENIPARKKFLKSDSAEISQIKNVLKAMALSSPHVEWKVKHRGKLLFYWPVAESFLQRAQDVLEIKKMYYQQREHEGFTVEIAFSDPATTLRVSRQIWLFVQDRWVQDKTLQAAVMEAYRSLLMHGEYPYCVVRLKTSPDQVDVNIHPTKSQIKFLEQKEAFRAVHYCLREALEKAPWLEVPKKISQNLAEPMAQPENLHFEQESFAQTQFKAKSLPREEVSPPTRSFGKRPEIPAPAIENRISLDDLREVAPPNLKKWSRLQVVGQVDLTYIVTQDEAGMILIDQHAAHERVAFERLMQGWKSGGIEQQRFLLPLTVDLEEAEVDVLISYQADLAKMGIEIEQAGPATISIASAPSIIREAGMVKAIHKLASDVVEKGGSFAMETAIADIFATMACHSVIRAGQALSHEEMSQLLVDMDEFPLSGFCPHGRSVSIEKSFVQLEKDFGRRV